MVKSQEKFSCHVDICRAQIAQGTKIYFLASYFFSLSFLREGQNKYLENN